VVFRVGESDEGEMVIEADATGCENLIAGLARLREGEPGLELTTTSFVLEDGFPKAMSAVTLKRLPDDDPDR